MKKTKVRKQNKGFRAMSKEDQLRICTMGGKAVAKKRGWMKFIGRLGGLK